MEKEIIEELEKIGFRRQYKGFGYVKEIIELLRDRKQLYDFNLKACYAVVARKHRRKQSSVKGDINYLMITLGFTDYSQRKALNYSGFTDMSDVTIKKLIEIVLERLYL